MSTICRLKAWSFVVLILFASSFLQTQAYNLQGMGLAVALVCHTHTTKFNDKEIQSASEKITASSKVPAKPIKKRSRRLEPFKKEP